jgi:serine/threonine protein kinase
LPADLSVKVLDFGIAKLADEHAKDPRAGTGTAMALGTPSYMPPEQLTSARDVDARADVYALGAMVFEMLTGSVPWGDTGFAELHGRMMHEPTPDPRRLNPALSKRVAHGGVARAQARPRTIAGRPSLTSRARSAPRSPRATACRRAPRSCTSTRPS